MGTKTRLGSYCTKRANNGVNLVTSRNINTRLARPITQTLRHASSSPYRKAGVTYQSTGASERPAAGYSAAFCPANAGVAGSSYSYTSSHTKKTTIKALLWRIIYHMDASFN